MWEVLEIMWEVLEMCGKHVYSDITYGDSHHNRSKFEKCLKYYRIVTFSSFNSPKNLLFINQSINQNLFLNNLNLYTYSYKLQNQLQQRVSEDTRL